jgi:carboxyl-terminal processing protease
MKVRVTLLLITILVNGGLNYAQSPLFETKKWAATCQIWGFLKYYHPKVASGQLDWDAQLLEFIPKIRNINAQEELSQLFIEWIDELGPVKKSRKLNCKRVEYFEKNFNLSWIDSSECFSEELSAKLRFIEEYRYNGDQFYVKIRDNASKNIVVTNELDYVYADLQSEDIRLLALFRYWNKVEYFFPYKYQTDTPWGQVLNAMIPKFLNLNNNFEFLILELVVSIDDSHGWLQKEKMLVSYFQGLRASALLKYVEDKAVVVGFHNDSIGAEDGLQVGDVILKMNNQDIKTIFENNKQYILGSNTLRKKCISGSFLLNGMDSLMELKIRRGGKTFAKVVARYPYSAFDYKESRILESNYIKDSVGYINLKAIKISEIDSVMQSMDETKALIIDLRNGAYNKAPFIINYISSQKQEFYKELIPDVTYPGKFIFKNTYKVGGKGPNFYCGKVILLVDENVHSNGEFTTMCFQTGDDVTTIGSQTSGADGNISRFNMVGGYKTKFSGIGIFYPDGTETQRVGVKIDIPVEHTIEGVAAGRDEILEKAIEFINE